MMNKNKLRKLTMASAELCFGWFIHIRLINSIILYKEDNLVLNTGTLGRNRVDS